LETKRIALDYATEGLLAPCLQSNPLLLMRTSAIQTLRMAMNVNYPQKQASFGQVGCLRMFKKQVLTMIFLRSLGIILRLVNWLLVSNEVLTFGKRNTPLFIATTQESHQCHQ
jgi:hypothetical protein